MTFGFPDALRLWLVFGLGAAFCFEDEAPHVFDFSCVGEGCPESRRSVKARSMVADMQWNNRNALKVASRNRYNACLRRTLLPVLEVKA
jgi:hypothetical protein